MQDNINNEEKKSSEEEEEELDIDKEFEDLDEELDEVLGDDVIEDDDDGDSDDGDSDDGDSDDDEEIVDEEEDDLEGEEPSEDSDEDAEELIESPSGEDSGDEYLKTIVEGALFVAGRPVTLEELNIKLGMGKRDLVRLLEDLMMDYLMRSTAFEIIQIQESYSLQLKAEITPKVKKFAESGLIPDKFLKTLTIIALKQPIMKNKLKDLHGAKVYDHCKWLLENGFIEAFKKGRSSELVTTDKFADVFGLSRDKKELKKQMVLQLGL